MRAAYHTFTLTEINEASYKNLEAHIKHQWEASDRPPINHHLVIIRHKDTGTTLHNSTPATAVSAYLQFFSYSKFLYKLIRMKEVVSYWEQVLKNQYIFNCFQEVPVKNLAECSTELHPIKAICDALLSPSHQLQVMSIIGEYGSGKTSLLSRVSWELIQKNENSTSRWVIPVLLCADQLNTSNPANAVWQAANQIFKGRKLSQLAINQLITSNRIILMLDGIDESHLIRNAYDIISLISNFIDIGITRICISVRQEFFASQQEAVETFMRWTLSSRQIF